MTGFCSLNICKTFPKFDFAANNIKNPKLNITNTRLAHLSRFQIETSKSSLFRSPNYFSLQGFRSKIKLMISIAEYKREQITAHCKVQTIYWRIIHKAFKLNVPSHHASFALFAQFVRHQTMKNIIWKC